MSAPGGRSARRIVLDLVSGGEEEENSNRAAALCASLSFFVRARCVVVMMIGRARVG
jgi:hypothetical protein